MEPTDICKTIREDTAKCIASIGVGHVGGCFSIVEILADLYFIEMNIDPSNPKMQGRDRLIVSKGHAGPAVYAALANRGYFDKALLLTLNQGGTNLPSHCDMNLTPGTDMTTGSLGQGFSCAVKRQSLSPSARRDALLRQKTTMSSGDWAAQYPKF